MLKTNLKTVRKKNPSSLWLDTPVPAPLSHTTTHSSYGYTHMYTGYRVSAQREGDWKVATSRAWGSPP